MNSKKSLVVVAIASVVGAWLGYHAVGAIIRKVKKPGSNPTLAQVASELNRTLPTFVDKESRLDSTQAGARGQFIYFYTLVNRTKAEIVPEEFVALMKPKLIANYKTSSKMERLRRDNVELEYIIRDRDGAEVVRINISPKDF